MKTIVIGSPRNEFCEILEQNFEYELKAKLICLENEQELVKWAQQRHSADLLILNQKLVDFKSVLPAFQKLNPSPLIHLYRQDQDDQPAQNKENFHLDDFTIEDILRNTLSSIAPEKQKSFDETPDYVPFAINYFYNLETFCSDIYIKLNKKGQEQFVKRINAKDEIEHENLKKYEDSGLQYLYVKKEYRFQFINQAVNETIEELKSAHVIETLRKKQDDHTPQEKTVLHVGNKSFKLTSEMLNDLGVSENTVKLTHACVKSMRQNLKGLHSVANLLEQLLKQQVSYAYKRSHIEAMFNIEVLKRLDWFSREQIPQLAEQMTYASFLHDIHLLDEKLLRIHSKLDLYKSDLSEDQKKLVLNHANMISTMVQNFPKSPANVDTILKQHHGTSNGIGFSENLNSGLPKLVIIFMVVEKFVIRLLDFKRGEEKLIDLLNDLDNEFALPSYKKVVEAIKETILSAAKTSSKENP